VSAQHTAPEIVSTWWTASLHTGFPDVPPPGRETSFGCTAHDADGGALTITLQLETAGCLSASHCWSQTQSFGSRLGNTSVTHAVQRAAPAATARGMLTCTVSQAGGATTGRSVCFRTSGAPACP
jgi:hypothetical protein